MKEVAGDLIKLAKNGKFDVIVHGCDCECTMGGGIAKQIRKAFSEAYAADRRTTACDSRKIGSFSFAKVKLDNGEHLVIVNGYTATCWRAGQLCCGKGCDEASETKLPRATDRVPHDWVRSGRG